MHISLRLGDGGLGSDRGRLSVGSRLLLGGVAG